MKKLTALLALFLLLTLLAQGACAATVNSYSFYNGDATPDQSENLLFCDAKPVDTPFSYYSNFFMKLSSPYSENQNLRSSLHQSFIDSFSKENLSDPEPGYVRKAMLVDMKLFAKHSSYNDSIELEQRSNGNYARLYPYIPLTEFIPAGTQFRNLRVYHGKEQINSNDNLPSGWAWQFQTSAMYNGLPTIIADSNGSKVFSAQNKLLPDHLTTSRSNYWLQLAIDYGFSPFVIVWDELNTGAPGAAVPAPLTPPDVPQTGDSSSLAPWLLLLGGAFALLALRRRSQHAS